MTTPGRSGPGPEGPRQPREPWDPGRSAAGDPPRIGGYYPQEEYYASGWQAPASSMPRPPRKRHVHRVLIGLAIVIGLGIVVGAVVGVRFWLESRPLGEVESARTAAARQLDVGHCIGELPADGTVARVQVVPCDAPHDAEVVGVLRLDGDEWPGARSVEQDAADYCRMDRAQLAAGFRPVAWSPTEAGWQQGDRKAVCLAWLEDGAAVGSFTAGDDVRTS